MEQILDSKGLTEQQAIERYRQKNYPKPALTADVVVFRREKGEEKLLLIKRGGHPFIGKWALPGGFANENEPVELTAARELKEETGVSDISMRLVGVFSRPERDPRGWVVSAAFAAVIEEDIAVLAGDDAAKAEWFTLKRTDSDIRLINGEAVLSPDELAFDHGDILLAAISCCGL